MFANQYGFTPQHSTEFTALDLVDRIMTEMDQPDTPIKILLYLSKAFDTIDHTILLNITTHNFVHFYVSIH